MGQDDLDKRFVELALAANAIAPDELATAAATAVAAKRTLSWAVVAGARKRPALLAILRRLHGATDDQASDAAFARHLDRLVGRFAVKSGLLEASALKAASIEEEARRASGRPARLGTILVEQKVLDAGTAKDVFARYEKRARVCADCYAPNPRDAKSGQMVSKDCVRCGAAIGARSSSWLGGDAPGEAEAPAAPKQRVVGAKSDKTSRAVAGKSEKKIRAPAPPQEPAAPWSRNRKIAAFGAVAGILAIVGVAAVLVSASRAAEERWHAFPERVARARAKRGDGAIADAAKLYVEALESVRKLEPPDAARRDLASAAAAEATRCEELLAKESDVAALGELATTTPDPELAQAACARLGASSDAAATAALEKLVAHPQESVRRAALAAGVARGKTGTSILGLAIRGADEDLARKAATALLAVDDPSAGAALAAAVERFPKDGDLAGKIGEKALRWRDPGAVPVLRLLARSSRLSVSEPALRGLAAIADAESTPELVLGLDAHEELQLACARALKKIGAPALPALAAALAKGQPTAARGLAMVGTDAAWRAIGDALPKLSWGDRGVVLEFVLAEAKSPAALRPAIAELIDQARVALKKRDASVERAALASLVDAARAFGFTDAAAALRFDLVFVEWEDRQAEPLDRSFGRLPRADLGTDGRIEVRNKTLLPMVLYAKGPRRIELKIPAKTDVGRNVPPGTYAVAVAFVLENGNLAAHGLASSVVVAKGNTTAIQYGKSAGDLARVPQGGAGDEGRKAAVRKVFERAFHKEQLVEAAMKRVAERRTSPFAKPDKLETAHYEVTTDAGGPAAARVGKVVEEAFEEYARTFPISVEGKLVVRFFARQGDYDAWRTETSINAQVGRVLVGERDLIARSRALAAKVKNAGFEFADLFESVAKALDTTAGLDTIELDDLDAYEDALDAIDATPRLTARDAVKAFLAIQGGELILVSLGLNSRGTVLGHYNRVTKELGLFDGPSWEDTARHEAFHQYLAVKVARAPSWLNEGLATFFEAYPTGGRNGTRIAELRATLDRQPDFVSTLKVTTLVTTERLSSLDYATAWSFVFYLVEKEPNVLAKILSRVRDGKLTPLGVIEAIPDLEATEREWRKVVATLVQKG